jgi:dTDP-4-amino-4,6-dideoxygalactose transaminase
MKLLVPQLPTLENISDMLKNIDNNKHYTNFGNYHDLYLNKLSKYLSVSEKKIILTSSGTTGLDSLIHTQKLNKKYCLLPSWTFSATCHAVIKNNLVPFFVDVDFNSQQITEETLRLVPKHILKDTALVILVSPFGGPLKYSCIKKYLNLMGIPMILDNAAAIDSSDSITVPYVISTHTTKLHSTGEGGFVVTRKLSEAKKVFQYTNFGFSRQSKKVNSFGMNYKLSEYHSIIGLESLKHLPQKINELKIIAEKYRTYIPQDFFMKGWGSDWMTSTCIITLPSQSCKKRISREFLKRKIPFRNWWSKGCHMENIFSVYKKIDLKNTNALAQRTIGIPFHQAINEKNILCVSKVINNYV